MKRESIKPWMVWGGLFIIIYIILTIYSFSYKASYEPEHFTDFGEMAPLIFTNFPGLVVVLIIRNLLNFKVTNSVSAAFFWIIMIGVNLLFYFGIGASIAMVWEMVRKLAEKNDQKAVQ
jgi:uncharacterized protein YacL